MTDNERMFAREQYFDEYRQTNEQFANIQTRIKYEEEKFSQLMADLHEASNELHHRVAAMRRVVTLMLETGYDPVEAKLKIDEHTRSTLWNDRGYNLGALGAVTSSSGANGPAGSINVSAASIISQASSKLRI